MTTDDNVGDDGISTLSNTLKANTTLTSLVLDSKEEWKKEKEMKNNEITDSVIGDDGAKAIGETLKVNTTLTSLSIGSN